MVTDVGDGSSTGLSCICTLSLVLVHRRQIVGGMMKTIMYCHGRGSTGRGSKATIIKDYFSGHNFIGNDYPTDDPGEINKDKPMPCPLHQMKEFWRYVQILAGDIKIHKPDVIVASSFGGAVLTRVILEGGWTRSNGSGTGSHKFSDQFTSCRI